MPERDLGGIRYDRGADRFSPDKGVDDDIQGDILVLDPRQFGQHVPGVDFTKQQGRPNLEMIPEEGYGEELLLEPETDYLRKKITVPDFSK